LSTFAVTSSTIKNDVIAGILGSAPPPVEEPFLMLILPWNFRKFSCKIYPFPWNFLVKITLAHGISILN
jgi:hypothetical protein